MFHRIALTLALFLVSVTAASTLYFPYAAEPSYFDNGFKYIVTDDDCVTVTGFDLNSERGYSDIFALSVPQSLGGKTVIAIGDWAFSKVGLTSVVLPDTVTRIGRGAFYKNASMTVAILPSNLKVIDDDAFSGCLSLKGIVLPEGLEEIGNGVFVGCSSFLRVYVPESVTAIGYHAFAFGDVVIIYGAIGSSAEDYCAYDKPCYFVPIKNEHEYELLENTIVIKIGSNIIPISNNIQDSISLLYEPYIQNGRTMIPLDVMICDLLDGEFVSTETDHPLKARVQEIDILMALGQEDVFLGDFLSNCGQALVMVNNCVFVPVRVFESFFEEIRWHEASQTVTLIPIR